MKHTLTLLTLAFTPLAALVAAEPPAKKLPLPGEVFLVQERLMNDTDSSR